MRFAGDGLVPFLTSALAHLRASGPEPADLTVYVWDSASTGIPLPACPWTPDGVFGEARTVVENWPGVEFVAFPHGGEIDVLDRARGLGFHYLGGAHPTAGPQSSLPLLTILDWWLAERALHCIHAAAVGLDSGGVLLAGRGGSGKSTTALACLQSPSATSPTTLPALRRRRAARARALQLGEAGAVAARAPLFLTPREAPSEPCEEKEVVFLERAFRQKLLPGFPIAPSSRRGSPAAPPRRSPRLGRRGDEALAPSRCFSSAGHGNAGCTRSPPW
jgi:hypothetical protein